MAIEYMIDLGCPAKDELGDEGLPALVKLRRTADSLEATLLEQDPECDVRATPIETLRVGPEGESEPVKTTIGELFDSTKPLDAFAPGCEGCPANIGGQSFGCYSAIHYPIGAEAERWLLERLPEELSSTAGMFLTQAIAEYEYDGAIVAELRAQKDTFFEDLEPESVTLGRSSDDEAKTTVTADQALQILFFAGGLSPTHALMLALFFGIVPHDTSRDAFVAAVGDADARRDFLRNAGVRDVPQSPVAAPFLRFFEALLTAASLDVAVLVSP